MRLSSSTSRTELTVNDRLPRAGGRLAPLLAAAALAAGCGPPDQQDDPGPAPDPLPTGLTRDATAAATKGAIRERDPRVQEAGGLSGGDCHQYDPYDPAKGVYCVVGFEDFPGDEEKRCTARYRTTYEGARARRDGPVRCTGARRR